MPPLSDLCVLAVTTSSAGKAKVHEHNKYVLHCVTRWLVDFVYCLVSTADGGTKKRICTIWKIVTEIVTKTYK